MRNLIALLVVVAAPGCSSMRHVSFSSGAHSAPAVVADDSFFEAYAATRRFSLGTPRSIKITPDGSAALFLRSGPRSFVQDLYEFDTATGKERLLLTADQILQGAQEKLSAEEKARRERMRSTARGIASFQLSKDGSKILAPLSGRLFVIDRVSGAVTELKSDAGYPLDPQFSPDASKVACVRNGDLYVMDVATGQQRRLTKADGNSVTNGLAEFVAQEEMGRFHGYWWSPDGTRLAYQRTDTSMVETLHIMDETHPEKDPQAWRYPRPGKANAEVRLGTISVNGGETTWVQWDRDRYPYLATVKWKKNAPLSVLVQNREQTEEALFTVDVDSGYTTQLLLERDEAWLNLDQKMPFWLPDGRGFLWTTERNGSWQIEMRNRTGRLEQALTSKDFGYRGFVSYDNISNALYLTGSGDPTQRHVYRVALDPMPGVPQCLTERPGLHGFEFSKDHSVYLHTVDGADGSRSYTLNRRTGEVIGSLKSVAEQPPFMPDVELTTVGTDPKMHAVLIRPRNFGPRRKYPVIVNVYGGPHAQMVQDAPRHYLLQQWVADHGFVVVSIDGRGTPARGRAWERITKNDLIDVPLQDQVDGLQALGKKYHELDLSRVGIYGWSFGGYFSAMAVMRRGDVFHAGVAGAPVADWRDYDTHYTERYMGLPDKNEAGYDRCSVLTHAAELERPLMIIHGTADDNVYFMHSMKLSDALFRAGKYHEFLVLSDFTHMVADPTVTMRLNQRIVDFFERNLAGR